MKQTTHSATPAGKLYIIPTPIGNLADITQRALTLLAEVDLIAAEDTRHTGRLLQHYAISTRLFPLHDHNERQQTQQLIDRLHQGLDIALVADAGTPLINDPGYFLVRHCRAAGLCVVPLPGACAAITALSASGLPTDRFCFEGFLLAKHVARCQQLRGLARETRTLIFYQSPHRLSESLQDIANEMGSDRYVILAREMTKTWESIHGAPVGELIAWVQADNNRSRGEMVLIIEGCREQEHVVSEKAAHTLMLLRQTLPLKQAVALTAQIHDLKKNLLYQYALQQARE